MPFILADNSCDIPYTSILLIRFVMQIITTVNLHISHAIAFTYFFFRFDNAIKREQ